jgi:hypothetical protein
MIVVENGSKLELKPGSFNVGPAPESKNLSIRESLTISHPPIETVLPGIYWSENFKSISSGIE